MDSRSREIQRREVRASVFRICLRAQDMASVAAKGLTDSQVAEALVSAGLSPDQEEGRAWIEEDLADFGRAVLVSELVSRRVGESAAKKPSARRSRSRGTPESGRTRSTTPSVADLLDGMLAQEKKGT
jgi:hypothetical protein